METNNVQKTVSTIQAITPLGEPIDVPINVGPKTPIGVTGTQKISQFADLPKDVSRKVKRILASSKNKHDLVTAVDEVFPAVLVNGHWQYSKIADIAMVMFEDKQKLH